jgi:sortase A
VIRTLTGRVLKTIGIVIIGYLILSRAYHTFANSIAASHYQTRIGAEDSAFLRSEYEKAEAYNRVLSKQDAQNLYRSDGGEESGSAEEKDGYEDLLNVGNDGVMAVLTIPSIGVRLPVYHDVTDQTMSKGCGHLRGTSLPVGGKSTHAVLFGHRGLPDAKLFTDLDRLKNGDLFTLSVLGKELHYRVISQKVVRPDETDDLKIREGRDLVTLVTCTPYGINTHRLLVCGERAEEGMEDFTHTAKSRNLPEKLYAFFLKPAVVYAGAASDLIVSVLLLWRIWCGRTGKKKRPKKNKRKELADSG